MRRGNPVAPLTFRKVELMSDSQNFFYTLSVEAGEIEKVGEMWVRTIFIDGKYSPDDEGTTKKMEVVLYAGCAENLTVISKL